MNLIKLKAALSDFLIAPRANCLGCKSPLGTDKGFLCAQCYASLSPLYTTSAGTKKICNLCGQEIPGRRCRCGGRLNNAYTSYSAYAFASPVSPLVKAFKYSYVTRLSEWMADEMIRSLRGERDFEIVTCVPMHFLRKVKRGYNQSGLLAEKIALKTGVPFQNLLVRKRYTVNQARLSAKKRRSNLTGAFELKKDVCVKGKRILLIDDVRTTGATLISCAKVLMNNGARCVIFLTLCSPSGK